MFSSLLAGALRRSGAHSSREEARNFLAWCRGKPVGFRLAFWGRFLAALTAVLIRSRLSHLRATRRLGSRLRRLLGRGDGPGPEPGPVPMSVDVGGWCPGPYFFRAQEIDALTRYARSRWPDQVQALVRWGDQIRRGIFPLVSGIEHDFSQGVRWDFPAADREQLFFLNRFAYAPVLAKAYRYTLEPGYVRTLISLMEDWGAKNPPGHPLTWESYSVSERISNWIQAAYLLEDVAEFRQFAVRWLMPQLARHAEFLAAHLETSVGHNHLVNNARALLVYGLCFPGLSRAKESWELGWNLICREMPRQTLADGIFREQSSHYHLLLTRTFTEAFLLARAYGLRPPLGMVELLERMYLAMASMIRPDGSLPYVGDICPDIEGFHLTGLLAVGAVLFGRADFKRPEAFNEHAMWYLSEAGLRRYEALSADPPLTWARNFPRGGLVALGYRQQEGSGHVLLHADPSGQVVFHGDMDPLGVDVWLDGRSVIRDTGNYSYNRDFWWGYFRSPAAQNTIVVDGLPPWPEPGCDRWLPRAYCGVEAGTDARFEEDGAPVGEAWHCGYHRLPRPVRLRRQVRLYPPHGLLITDFLEGVGIHTAEAFFHLGPGIAVLDRGLVRLVSEDGLGTVWMAFESDLPLTVDFLDGWVATAYGRKEPDRVVRIRLQGEIPGQIHTVISVDSRWIERIRSSERESLGAASGA